MWPLATLLVFAGPPVRGKEWILTFVATETIQIKNPDPAPVETRSYTQTVALGENYLVVQDDRQKLIYDFANRRFHRIGVGSQAFNVYWPLYGEVGGLEESAFERYAHGSFTRNLKGAEKTLFDRFETESALGVPVQNPAKDDPDPAIEQIKQGDALEFRHDGERVVRVIAGKVPLPAEYQRRFLNYLAYACAIHPKIRPAIARTGAVPDELTFTVLVLRGRRTVTLRLESSAAAESDSSVVPPTARPLLEDRDPFSPILAAVHAAEAAGHRVTRAEAIAFANNAVAHGRFLDAQLALREFGLQSGTSN